MRSKNAIKNILSSLFLQLATIICGFIVPKLFIDHYGSEVNGLVSSITQFLAYITLLESGFGPVVKSVLYKPIANKSKSEIERILKSSERFFRTIAKVFIAYIIVLCVIYPWLINGQFGEWYTISLIIIMAIGTFSEYFFGMTYKLYLQAEQKTYITSYIQIGTTLLNTLAVIIFVKLGSSIQIVKLVTALIFIVRPLLQNYYVKKKYHLELRGNLENYVIKQKWDGLAQHIAAVIHSNTDVTVLTILSTLKEVSVYAVYTLVVKGVKSITQAFNSGIDASFGDMMAKGEHENLNRRFSSYELFYYTVASILFICTMILITPFVSIYTNGITDADYVRPLFGVLIAASEFIWAIRLPYSSIVLAAGHFKQTMKGAWVEAIVNIVVSVILVFNFGIIGVAIGTILAMAIRTLEFMYYSSKHILKRSVSKSFAWLLLLAVETTIALLIASKIVPTTVSSYMEWIEYAAITLGITAVVVVPLNVLFHRNDIREIKDLLKRNRKGK